MRPGNWARDLADSYAAQAVAFENWPDTPRNRLGASANRAEEAKYRRIADDMDAAFPPSVDPCDVCGRRHPGPGTPGVCDR